MPWQGPGRGRERGDHAAAGGHHPVHEPGVFGRVGVVQARAQDAPGGPRLQGAPVGGPVHPPGQPREHRHPGPGHGPGPAPGPVQGGGPALAAAHHGHGRPGRGQGAPDPQGHRIGQGLQQPVRMKIPGQDQPGAPAHGSLLPGRGRSRASRSRSRRAWGPGPGSAPGLEAGPDLGLLAFGPGQEGEGQGPERRIHGSAGKAPTIGRTGRRAQGRDPIISPCLPRRIC